MSYYRSETINLVEKRADHFQYVDQSVLNFISANINDCKAEQIFWNLDHKNEEFGRISSEYAGFADLNIINNKRRVNKFFEEINDSLDYDNYFITAAETKENRKERIIRSAPTIFGYLLYVVDFFFHRLFAKLKFTRKLYFKITKGRKRAISLTELLGRLVSCGFNIIEHQEIGSRTYVISKKEREPVYDLNPTYGALVMLKRVGYKAKRIQLYKLRTMHPYSEYLQKYLYELNGTENGDKIKGDFRVTNWGKVFRKLWIDELPMLWNWIKRDLKLVGVRPLSEHKFYTYPEYLQEKRIKVKPGLVPPFYADLPETPVEFYNTEEKYLDLYFQKPIRTDIKYFFKAMYNIICKRARSQ